MDLEPVRAADCVPSLFGLSRRDAVNIDHAVAVLKARPAQERIRANAEEPHPRYRALRSPFSDRDLAAAALPGGRLRRRRGHAQVDQLRGRPASGILFSVENSTPSTDLAFDETSKDFATEAARLDPDKTITRLVIDETLGRAARANAAKAATAEHLTKAPAPLSLPVPLPDLHYMPLDPTESPLSARSTAEYEVTGVLAEGGMGRVLLARQRSLKRDVAIKILKSKGASGAVVDALLAEAIITGSIEHPCVVPVHALGRDAEGRPVLVMKRIEGVSWRELTRDPSHPVWASIAPDEGDRLDAHLEIFMAVCNAAHYAHSRGVVHRDLKLGNVMIGGFGEVYLVDWGIAIRIKNPKEGGGADGACGQPLGTPSYMAPEMVLGDPSLVDARTDVYLLGATLHAVLAGTPRHRGDTLVDVLRAARNSKPFAYGPDVPAELAAICNRATHVDPAQRFQSALEMRHAISSFRRHRGSIALSDQAAARLDEIDALLARKAAGRAAPEDELRTLKRMTECRFGFMQALDAWRGNNAAKVGLDRCLARMIEHEIERRDDEGARALLAELSEPRPDLAKRVDALTAEIEEARAREERLRSMERDEDRTVGARAQLALLAVLPLFATASIALLYGTGSNVPDQRRFIGSPVVLFVMLLAAFVATRRRLQSAVSRRAFKVLFLLPAAGFLHRVVAMLYGASVAEALATDMVIGALVTGAIALTALPLAGWASVPNVVGAIASALYPERAIPIFGVSALTSIAVLFAAWARSVSTKPGAR